MRENLKVYVYTTTPIEFVGEYESCQRAAVRLRLGSGSKTYQVVDGRKLDGRRKITRSKSLNKDVFLTSKKL